MLPASRAVVALLMLCVAIPARTQPPATSYVDTVDLYRSGQDQLALTSLAVLTTNEVERGRDLLINEFNSTGSESAATAIRAATLLHTTRALSVRAHGNFREFSNQFAIATHYINRLASRDRRAPFVLKWRLWVLAVLHGQLAVTAAREFGRQARDPGGDSPELLLALGATEEIGWTLHQDADGDTQVNGDLKEAERNYRQALVIMPDLTEARLRLGRVLALRDEPGALKVLEGVGGDADGAYRCLARLFEGEILERRGDLAEAEQRYLVAVSLVPTAQSAYMALAHIRHARGARAEAAEDVGSTTRAKGVSDTADPWFWYERGASWRGSRYLDATARARG